MKNSLLVLLTLFLGAFSLQSCDKDKDINPTSPPDVHTPAALTQAMQDIVEGTEIPGFAISIVKDNALLYQQAFGYADVQAKKPYRNQTIQHLASVSKTFVGAAIVKAMEEGYFTLETDINSLLPVTIVNPNSPAKTIRVKHLVSHTSGLLDVAATYLQENYYILPGEDISSTAAQALAQLGIQQRDARSLEDFLAEYYLEDGDNYSLENFAAAAPGTSWSYSNVATGLAAYLIESATGQSFASYVKEKIFLPLDMTQSTYQIDEVNRQELAQWYFNLDIPFPRYGNDSYPEGNVYTTNEDLGKYLLDMMKGIRGQSTTLFSTQAYELLFADQLAAGVVPSDFANNHGVFWIKDDNKIQHGGNSFGVSTYLGFDQTGQSGYALMTNMDASFDFGPYQEVAVRIDEAVNLFLQAN